MLQSISKKYRRDVDDWSCSEDSSTSVLEVRVPPPKQPLEFSTEQLRLKEAKEHDQTLRTNGLLFAKVLQDERDESPPLEPNPWESELEESGRSQATEPLLKPQLVIDARLERIPGSKRTSSKRSYPRL